MPQQRIWTQRLLSRHCMLSSQHVKSRSQTPKELLISSSLIAPAKLLAPFRAWDQFWEIKSDRNDGSLIAEADSGGVPRRLVWQAYYEVFSTLLGLESIHPFLSIKDHPFKDGSLYDSKFFIKHKPGQCAELIRIQSIYEKFLLLELRFPKANESTIEIEHFADQVVSNWNIMSGPTWRDEDHIDGGKRATGQLVLDVC